MVELTGWQTVIITIALLLFIVLCLKTLFGAGQYRVYKEENGILWIKEGGGEFEPLENHLKREHPKEYEMLKKRKKDSQ